MKITIERRQTPGFLKFLAGVSNLSGVRASGTIITFTSIIAFAFLSCRNQVERNEVLFDKVENLLEQQPDSALTLLYTITDTKSLRPEQFNRYLLLKVQAKDKSYKDITADTLIFDVKDYYLKQKQSLSAATAAFYCGRILYEQGNIEGATHAYLEAEQLAANTTVDNIKGLIHGNLCDLYIEQRLFDKAMKQGKNAVVLFNAAGNHKDEISALLKVGICFLHEEKIDSTFYYCRAGITLADRHNLPDQQVATRQSLGITALEIGDYALAKASLNEALMLLQGDDASKAKLFLSMANVYRMEQQADSALFYVRQSRDAGADDSYLQLSSWELQSRIEEEAGQYPEALSSYNEYVGYVFEAFDEERSAAVLAVQEKYDYERIRNEAGRKVIRTQYTAIFLLCMLLFVFAVAGYLFRKAAHNRKQALDAEDRVKSLMSLIGPDSGKTAISDRVQYQFEIMKETILFEENLTREERTKSERLIRKFYRIVFGEELSGTERLFHVLDELQGGLCDSLRERYPQLDEDELRICCLSYENIRDMDISIILGITVNMVQKKRSAIRRKIGIQSHGNLRDFFGKQFAGKISG